MKAEILCFWTVIIGAPNWGPKNVYFAMKFRAQKWKFSKISQLHRLYRPRGPKYGSGINDPSQIGLKIILNTCLNLYWGSFREMGKKNVVFRLLMSVSGPIGAPIGAPIKWKCHGWKIQMFLNIWPPWCVWISCETWIFNPKVWKLIRFRTMKNG